MNVPYVLVVVLPQTSLLLLRGRSAEGRFTDLFRGDSVGPWRLYLLQIRATLLGGCRGIGQGFSRLGIPVVVVAVETIVLMIDNSLPVVYIKT